MSAEQATEGRKEAPAPVHLMWMRVTRVRDGRVVEEGKQVRITADMQLDPFAYSSAWPPCQCPRHRDQ